MTARGEHGRWRSAWRMWELPELVAQITLQTAPDDPQSVSARQFDRDRTAAGWPDAPTSAAIRRQLGAVSWPVLLDVVFGEARRRWQEVARWLEPLQRERYTERDALEALRLVARLRGRPTLREGEYIEARCELLLTPAGRGLRLPSAEQVPYYAGRRDSWTETLRAAGLDPDLDEDRGPRYERGLSIPEALDACITVHGTLPTKQELRRFARANNLMTVQGRDERLGPAELEEVARRRALRGLATPTERPALHLRPDYSEPADPSLIPADLRRLKRVRGSYKPEDVRAAISMFLDQTPSGLLPGRALYNEFVLRTPGVPSMRVVHRRGGFAALRDELISDRIRARQVKQDAGT